MGSRLCMASAIVLTRYERLSFNAARRPQLNIGKLVTAASSECEYVLAVSLRHCLQCADNVIELGPVMWCLLTNWCRGERIGRPS